MIKRVLQYPHAAIQAMQVMKSAIVLPEPDGVRVGRSGSGPDLSLLVLGDSSAAGVGVTHQSDALAGQLVADLSSDHRVSWRLLAKSGVTAGWAQQVLAEEEAFCADIAVVALGLNDVKNAVPMRIWKARMTRVLDLLAQRHGVQRVYWSAIPPMGRFPLLPEPLRGLLGRRSDRFNAELIALLEQHPVGRFLPLDLDLDETHMAPDGFHPGPLIYQHWAQAAARMIRTDLG